MSDLRRLLRDLEECYRLPRGADSDCRTKNHSEEFSLPRTETTAGLLARQCTQNRSRQGLANQLKPGWAKCIEFSHSQTCAALEQLVALPSRERFLTALRFPSKATSDLIFALIDLAFTLRARCSLSASSLAQTALALTSRLSEGECDLSFLLNEQAALWVATAEEDLLNDHLSSVALYLKVAETVAAAGSNSPVLSTRIGMARAQLYWQQANIEACLTEVNAALTYCEVAGDNGMTGTILFLKGVALATTGMSSSARTCLERSLILLSGSNRQWVTPLAESALGGLDELI